MCVFASRLNWIQLDLIRIVSFWFWSVVTISFLTLSLNHCYEYWSAPGMSSVYLIYDYCASSACALRQNSPEIHSIGTSKCRSTVAPNKNETIKWKLIMIVLCVPFLMILLRLLFTDFQTNWFLPIEFGFLFSLLNNLMACIIVNRPNVHEMNINKKTAKATFLPSVDGCPCGLSFFCSSIFNTSAHFSSVHCSTVCVHFVLYYMLITSHSNCIQSKNDANTSDIFRIKIIAIRFFSVSCVCIVFFRMDLDLNFHFLWFPYFFSDNLYNCTFKRATFMVFLVVNMDTQVHVSCTRSIAVAVG